MKRNSWKRSTGIIAIAAGEISRYSEFAVCLGELGLAMRGGWHVRANYGCDVAFSRNRLAESFMDDPKKPSWLWFIDDDHTFRAETLQQLLDSGAKIIAPLVLKKHHPFPPVARVDGRPIALKGRVPQLREVHDTGTAGLLIHRDVLEKMERPYFRADTTANGAVSEDRGFCRRARAAGFKIMVDTRLPISHYTPAAIVLVQDPDSAECYAMLVVHGEQGPTAIPLPYEEPWLDHPAVDGLKERTGAHEPRPDQPIVTAADEIPADELEELRTRRTLEGHPPITLDVDRDSASDPLNEVPHFERPPFEQGPALARFRAGKDPYGDDEPGAA